MKYFGLILFFTYSGQILSQYKLVGYDTLSFDKVLIYELDKTKSKTHKGSIIAEGQVSSNFKILDSLKRKEVKQLFSIINDTSTYGMPPLSCSTINYGFVFYKSSQIRHNISLSINCDNLSSSFLIKANEMKKINSGEDGYSIYSSFTSKGKKKIVKFLNRKGADIKYIDRDK